MWSEPAPGACRPSVRPFQVLPGFPWPPRQCRTRKDRRARRPASLGQCVGTLAAGSRPAWTRHRLLLASSGDLRRVGGTLRGVETTRASPPATPLYRPQPPVLPSWGAKEEAPARRPGSRPTGYRAFRTDPVLGWVGSPEIRVSLLPPSVHSSHVVLCPEGQERSCGQGVGKHVLQWLVRD